MGCFASCTDDGIISPSHLLSTAGNHRTAFTGSHTISPIVEKYRVEAVLDRVMGVESASSKWDAVSWQGLAIERMPAATKRRKLTPGSAERDENVTSEVGEATGETGLLV